MTELAHAHMGDENGGEDAAELLQMYIPPSGSSSLDSMVSMCPGLHGKDADVGSRTMSFRAYFEEVNQGGQRSTFFPVFPCYPPSYLPCVPSFFAFFQFFLPCLRVILPTLLPALGCISPCFNVPTVGRYNSWKGGGSPCVAASTASTPSARF